MNDSSRLLGSLPPSMRDGLESLARTEGVAIDDLVIIALAEKLARAEQARWIAAQTQLESAGATDGSVVTRLRQGSAAHGIVDPSELHHEEETLKHLSEAEEQERHRLAELFDGAPVFIAMLAGPEHVFEMVNQAYLHLMGDRDFIGKRVVDCVPEVAGTIWMDHLDRVYRTGTARVDRGARLTIAPVRGEPLLDKYVDYTYKARRRADGAVYGITAIGVDTSLVHELFKSSGGAGFLLDDAV